MPSDPLHEDPLADVIDATGIINRNVSRILHAARAHLGMEVAFISEFQGDERVFRHVDSVLSPAPLRPGDRLSLHKGYCQRIVQGELPELIPDTADVPGAMALPETAALPIGSHIGVPIHLASGQLYGTFCCFSRESDHSLNQRDLGMLRTLAELIAHQLDADLAMHRRKEYVLARLNEVIGAGQPHMVYQPIFGLDDGRVTGVECLSRFQTQPARTPDIWFNEASSVGRGPELELRAIRTALTELADITGDFYIAINSSPRTLMHMELHDLLLQHDPERIVLEITEHDHVDDYGALLRALEPLRARGVRVAIDDAGAGYASMRHILNIQPELIKLDISLTQNINGDAMRRALASALVEFGRSTGSVIVAEGVETAEEMETLYALGVRRIQGYHLAPPLARNDLATMLQHRHRH